MHHPFALPNLTKLDLPVTFESGAGPGSKTPGEPGHTRDTRDTRFAQTNLATKPTMQTDSPSQNQATTAVPTLCQPSGLLRREATTCEPDRRPLPLPEGLARRLLKSGAVGEIILSLGELKARAADAKNMC